ncbi:MAG: NAD(P) transhydrogenase subunit alpha [Limnochordia bacterium]|jgi:NAD(P) transhydrogenase subunit alpha|nr:NAD(P) transhydrogenase subunit alpha [Limnochordia bacterium]
MTYVVLVLAFVGAAILGYKLISDVPSLIHTPLMSGMNALSGITIVGALSTTGLAVATGSQLVGFIAIVLAMINVVGGFMVTNRMLKMFKTKKGGSRR